RGRLNHSSLPSLARDLLNPLVIDWPPDIQYIIAVNTDDIPRVPMTESTFSLVTTNALITPIRAPPPRVITAASPQATWCSCSQPKKMIDQPMLAAIDRSKMPQIKDTIRPRVKIPVMAWLDRTIRKLLTVKNDFGS